MNTKPTNLFSTVAVILLAAIVQSSGQSLSTVQFTAASYWVSETGAVAIITVERIGDPGGTALVEYDTTSGTAIDGQDYLGQTGSLRFIEETNLTIAIPILNDASMEGEESVWITLFNPFETLLGERWQAVLSIRDNDRGIEFTSTDYVVPEEAGAVTVTLHRSGDGVAELWSVECRTVANGSATPDLDFVPISESVNFAPGETTKTLVIPILDDVAKEVNESVELVVSGAAESLGFFTSAMLTIVDNDFGVEFGEPSRSVSETQTAISLPVQRMGHATNAFTVAYATHDETATGGEDYVTQMGILSFAKGQTNAVITIALLNDALREGSECFSVVLMNPTDGVSLGFADAAYVCIEDNDRGVEFGPIGTVQEDVGTVTLPVSRIGDSTNAFTVDYATNDRTARASEDYIAQSGTLRFEVGQTNASITLTILNDALRESDEDFQVTLTNPTDGVPLGFSPIISVIIVDNDFGVEFDRELISVDETTATITLSIRRGGDATKAFTVDYATNDGTATAGEDYVAQSGVLSFAEGQTNGTITITILNDTLRESSEQFTIVLMNPTDGVPLGNRSSLNVFIEDNDFGVEFSRSALSVLEGEGLANFIVQRRGDPTGPCTVEFATTDGSASAGADYLGVRETIAFADGETERTITVPVLNDALRESYESVRLTLSNPTGGVFLGAHTEATLTIVDDDSTGLDSWMRRDSGTGNWLFGVTYGNGLFVAVGEGGTIVTSTNAQTWIARTNAGQTFYSVAHGNGIYVAVGGTFGFCGGRGCFPGQSVIWSSRDGENWTQQSTLAAQVLFGVTYADGKFVVVGGDDCFSDTEPFTTFCFSRAILISENGSNWVRRFAAGAGQLNSIVFGAAGFVAVGDATSVVTSSNAIDWIERESGAQQGLFAAAHGNDTFIAVGGYTPGVILSSRDGISWSERYTNTNLHFAGATFGRGTFVAVGYDRRILTSPDGVHWTERDSGPNDASFSDVTFGNNTFVAVGSGGVILQSAPIVRLGLEWAATPTLSLSGPVGRSYRIEGASELRQTNAWEALATVTLTNSPQSWIDPGATNSGHGFYRAVLLP